MISTAQLVSRRESLRQRLTISSPTGRQIERLRNRLGNTDHMRNDGQESLLCSMVDADRAIDSITSSLTAEERQVWALRYSTSGHETYQRAVWATEIRRVELDDGLPTMMTGDGEEAIGSARDESGEVIPGRIVVQGRRARYLGFQEIGERLGISERQARRRYDSASAKIRMALAEQAHRMSLDSV